MPDATPEGALTKPRSTASGGNAPTGMLGVGIGAGDGSAPALAGDTNPTTSTQETIPAIAALRPRRTEDNYYSNRAHEVEHVQWTELSSCGNYWADRPVHNTSPTRHPPNWGQRWPILEKRARPTLLG